MEKESPRSCRNSSLARHGAPDTTDGAPPESREWGELSEDQQTAATALGYTSDTWPTSGSDRPPRYTARSTDTVTDTADWPASYSDSSSVLGFRLNETTTDECMSKCYSPNSRAICRTFACRATPQARECKLYEAATVASCYCNAIVREKRKESMDAPIVFLTQYDAQFCADSLVKFDLTQLSMVIVLAVVNTFLTIAIKVMAKHELHLAHSSQAVSVMTRTFVARFINTALIVLIVQAKGVPVLKWDWDKINPFSDITNFGLFQGNYDDMKIDWYQDVGYALILQMLLNIYEPHQPVVAQYLIAKLKFIFLRKSQDSQDVLNEMYAGPIFKMHERYPSVLNTIFIVMFYCSGLPLILLLGAGMLGITYAVDKYMMLKVRAAFAVASSLQGPRTSPLRRTVPRRAVPRHVAHQHRVLVLHSLSSPLGVLH